MACGCTIRCLERTAGEWFAKLDSLPTEEARTAAIHQLQVDLDNHMKERDT